MIGSPTRDRKSRSKRLIFSARIILSLKQGYLAVDAKLADPKEHTHSFPLASDSVFLGCAGGIDRVRICICALPKVNRNSYNCIVRDSWRGFTVSLWTPQQTSLGGLMMGISDNWPCTQRRNTGTFSRRAGILAEVRLTVYYRPVWSMRLYPVHGVQAWLSHTFTSCMVKGQDVF